MTKPVTWPFFRIAFLVTGQGQEQFLPRLFRSLEADGHWSTITEAKLRTFFRDTEWR